MILDQNRVGNGRGLAERSARREPSSANSLGRVVLSAWTAARLALGASLWGKSAGADCTPAASAGRYGLSSFLNVSRTGTRVPNGAVNVLHAVQHVDRPPYLPKCMHPNHKLPKVFQRKLAPFPWCPYVRTMVRSRQPEIAGQRKRRPTCYLTRKRGGHE